MSPIDVKRPADQPLKPTPTRAEGRSLPPLPPLPNGDSRDTERKAAAPRSPSNAGPALGPAPMQGMRLPATASDDRRLADVGERLNARLALADAVIADPRSRVPELQAGQGLVHTIDSRNIVLDARIVAVEGEAVTLLDGRSGAQSTTTRAALSARVVDRQNGLTIVQSQSITAQPVPSLYDREIAFKPLVERAVKAVELQRALGPKAYRVYAELSQRRSELAEIRRGLGDELQAWLVENSGITSMKRLALALVSEGEGFWEKAKEPEYLEQAPQRGQIARVQAAIGEIDRAIKSVESGSGFDFVPEHDGVTVSLYQFARSANALPLLTDQLQASAGLLRGAIAEKQLPDAWAAYQAVVQPYLFLPAKSGAASGDSFHAASGHPSYTYAVNQLIATKKLGDRRLVTTAAELRALHDTIASHWDSVFKLRASLDGGAMYAPDWRAPFDERAFDKEVARLVSVEADARHREAAGYVQLAQGEVGSIVALEPTLSQRALATVGAIVDSPTTWETIAIGALTAGTGSLLLTGVRGGVAGVELVNAARAAGVSARGAVMLTRGSAMFAAGAAIDGAAMHTGVNLIEAAVGNNARVDFTTQGYLESIAMYGAGELVGVAHAARLAKLGARPALGARVAEQARFAAQDAVATSAVSAAAAEARGDDIGAAIAGNLPFVVGAHTARAARLGRGAMREARQNETRERAAAGLAPVDEKGVMKKLRALSYGSAPAYYQPDALPRLQQRREDVKAVRAEVETWPTSPARAKALKRAIELEAGAEQALADLTKHARGTLEGYQHTATNYIGALGALGKQLDALGTWRTVDGKPVLASTADITELYAATRAGKELPWASHALTGWAQQGKAWQEAAGAGAVDPSSAMAELRGLVTPLQARREALIEAIHARQDRGELIRGRMDPVYRDEQALQGVRYFTPEERAARRVEVRDGLLYDSTGSVIDTSRMKTGHGDGRMIFVLGTDGHLYASEEHVAAQLRHSSFFAGGDVAMAGELVARGGRLTHVTNDSGHYKPERLMARQLARWLDAHGVDLSGVRYNEEGARPRNITSILHGDVGP